MPGQKRASHAEPWPEQEPQVARDTAQVPGPSRAGEGRVVPSQGLGEITAGLQARKCRAQTGILER